MNHQTKIAKLQSQLAKAYATKIKDEANQVVALVKGWGYKSLDEFLTNVANVGAKIKAKASGIIVAGVIKSTKAPAAAPAKAKAAKRKRAVIDDTKRAAIIADIKSDKLTNAKVAAKHGVSVPTVSNIKKAEGLVKKAKA